MTRDLIYVMLGGALGSGARFLVGYWVQSSGRFATATFLVNILGCFIIGLVSGISLKSEMLGRHSLLFLGTGLCGGFTTMSAFSVEALNLLRVGDLISALVYISATIAGAILSAFIGVLIGKSLA